MREVAFRHSCEGMEPDPGSDSACTSSNSEGRAERLPKQGEPRLPQEPDPRGALQREQLVQHSGRPPVGRWEGGTPAPGRAGETGAPRGHRSNCAHRTWTRTAEVTSASLLSQKGSVLTPGTKGHADTTWLLDSLKPRQAASLTSTSGKRRRARRVRLLTEEPRHPVEGELWQGEEECEAEGPGTRTSHSFQFFLFPNGKDSGGQHKNNPGTHVHVGILSGTNASGMKQAYLQEHGLALWVRRARSREDGGSPQPGSRPAPGDFCQGFPGEAAATRHHVSVAPRHRAGAKPGLPVQDRAVGRGLGHRPLGSRCSAPLLLGPSSWALL